jgi:hypothetical protein
MNNIIRNDIAHTTDATCQHPGCMAYRRLLGHPTNAVLHGRNQYGELSGRRCELSMLAAAGSQGLSAKNLVAARRHLAEHLGEPLGTRPVVNPDKANHSDRAAMGPDARNRVNLGRARVTKTAGMLGVFHASDHYVLVFLV